MKKSFRILMAAALLSFSSAPAAIAAETMDEPGSAQGTPLMVIRFNQSHVDYPMPLYNTLSRALEVKPAAIFDVVSVAPRAKVAHNQAYYDRMAAENTNHVLATLHEIGLPDRRIHLSSAIDAVGSSEVRIYVH